jgi:hypothetical protein
VCWRQTCRKTLENGGRAGGGGEAGQQCQPRNEEAYEGIAALWRGAAAAAAAAGWAYAQGRGGARTAGGLGCVSVAFQNVVISQGLLCVGGLGAPERRGPNPKSSVRVSVASRGRGRVRARWLRARAGGGSRRSTVASGRALWDGPHVWGAAVRAGARRPARPGTANAGGGVIPPPGGS